MGSRNRLYGEWGTLWIAIDPDGHRQISVVEPRWTADGWVAEPAGMFEDDDPTRDRHVFNHFPWHQLEPGQKMKVVLDGYGPTGPELLD